MKISQLTEELISYAAEPLDPAINPAWTCDKVKVGDPEKEITKVAVSMFATPDVVRAATAWGAELLVVHEPTYYNHMDSELPYPLAHEKKAFLEKSGITVFRFHDFAHAMDPDLICRGELKYMNLDGQYIKGDYFAVNRFLLDRPMTAKELALHLEKTLNIRHIRIVGCPDQKGKMISCCFGTPGHVADELEQTDFVLTGEICEWNEGELARDYAQFGYNKAILVMGHIASERDGMVLLKDILCEKHPEFETRYFECGELYSYTD